jgi:sulfur-carrier protein
MQVKFFATLRQIVQSSVLTVDMGGPASVRDLLAEMVRRYPALQPELFNEQGQLHQHVNIFVGGREATFLENGLDTVLNGDETVGIFPAVGGGA